VTSDDCPVCEGYAAATQREIDRAGDAHRTAILALKEAEASGEHLPARFVGTRTFIPDRLIEADALDLDRY